MCSQPAIWQRKRTLANLLEFYVDDMKSQLGINDIVKFHGASEEKGQQFCGHRSRPQTG